MEDRKVTTIFKTQAGTYVKEFVHGDLGRTHPRYAIVVVFCSSHPFWGNETIDYRYYNGE